MSNVVRHTALHLALVAMVLRALLPAGWMPDTTAHASTPFVICTMNGPLLSSAEGDKHKPLHDDGRQSDACPFAASIHVATPTATAIVVPPLETAWRAPPLFLESAEPNLSAHTPQSPRAPPSFA